MGKSRLEAFSDGVLAIIITIMVLDLHPPRGVSAVELLPLLSHFLSYVLSFVFIGIYWNNHHHLFQAVHRVTGSILWANLHLLFWLSLIPFATSWMGENDHSAVPVVLYGAILTMAGISYFILTRTLLSAHGPNSQVATALGSDFKGKVSILIYLVGMALCWVNPWIGYFVYQIVALMWLIPDRRIENTLHNT